MTNTSSPAPPLRVLTPLLAGSLLGALTEGGQVFVAGLHGGMETRVSAAAALEAFALVTFPLLVVSLLLSLVVALPAVRELAAKAPRALAGGESTAHESAGILLATAVLGGAAVVASMAGRHEAAAASALVASNTAIGVTLMAVVVLTMFVAVIAKWFVKAFVWLEIKIESTELPLALAIMLGLAALVAGASRLAPRDIAIPLAGGAIGAAFGVSFQQAPWRNAKDPEPKPSRVRARHIALVLAFATFWGFPAFASMAPTTRLLILARAPYAAAVVGGVRAATDRDGDGYSALLGGGDCNDSDPQVNPSAHDIPGNGIDENCSGSDATPFAAVHGPPLSVPSTLPPKPSFILVQLDALRPDHLGISGYGRPTSPNIDRFAKQAMWFRHAYSPAPSTRFALPAIFTGDEVDLIPQKRGPGIEFEMYDTPTLAAHLESAGYDRVGYTISYVVQHIKGLGQGFRIWDTPWPATEWKANEPKAATLTTDKALEYLGTVPADGSKPYFLFLHYRCTHDPYANQAKWNYGSAPRDRYDSAVAYCDDEVGRLLSTIDKRADASKTVTVVFSDHGELFGEHGFEYHGNSLYEPDVRTLFLVRAPGAKTGVIDAPVSITDMNPTLLAMAGLPSTSSYWNLLPYLLEGQDAVAKSAPRPIYMEADLTVSGKHRLVHGVLLGRLKYIDDTTANAQEMFDVEADPEERQDLAFAMPAERARLSELLESWRAATSKGEKVETPGLSTSRSLQGIVQSVRK